MNCWLKPLAIAYLWANGAHHHETVSTCTMAQRNLKAIQNVQQNLGCSSIKLQKDEDMLATIYKDIFNCTDFRTLSGRELKDIFASQNHYCTSTQNFLNSHTQAQNTRAYQIAYKTQDHWNCHPIKTTK